jgi:streptogramin lyase
VIVNLDQCGVLVGDIQANFTLDPDQPCEPPPLLVVPSSSASQLAVYDTSTLLPLPTSPFNTCANPSRIIFDVNNDVIATCRNDSKVQKHTKDGALLWSTTLSGCFSGARGAVFAPDGRLFTLCSNPGRIHQLDPLTGAEITSVAVPNFTFGYGIVADSDGLYVANLGSYVSKFYLDAGQPADLTQAWEVNAQVYGLSIDDIGNVWVGSGTLMTSFATIDGSVTGSYNIAGAGINGVMVGLDGFVYGASGFTNSVVKLDPGLGTSVNLPLAPGDLYSKGVTLDVDNNVYSMNLNSNTLTRITPAGVPTSFGGGILNYPYGYSGDQTGLNICLNTLVDTWLSGPIDTGTPNPQWLNVSWTSIEPPGTSISMYYSLDGGTTWTLIGNGGLIGANAPTLHLKAVLTAGFAVPLPTLQTVSLTYIP